MAKLPASRGSGQTLDVIQFASISGELAPNLWGRTDFEKYDSGWAEARNWHVDYRGGLFSRAGFEFGDVIQWTSGERVKYVEFQYSPDTANTYVVVLTDSKVRFIQNNAYVVEADVTVDSVANGTGNRITITATGHGFSDGDWVKFSGFTDSTLIQLNGRTCEVANGTTDTFDILDVITDSLITQASVGTEAATVARIYTVTSPYSSDDLERLQAVQIRDYVRLTHPDYPIKNLIRSSATSWSISNESIGRTIGQPSSVTQSASVNDSATHVYMITAVSEDGEEGLPVLYCSINGPNMVADGKKYIKLQWNAVSGAIRYKIYRSIEFNSNSNVFSNQQVGYIGTVVGTSFTDNGITPEFTEQPPVGGNPFANGRIRYVTVGNGGSGADYDDTISWPSGGSGANGYLVCDVGGSSAIRGIILLDGGKNYTGTTVSVGGAAGESLTAVLSASSGNNPHCAAVFQQRMIYAATDEHPLRVYGSKVGLFSNFDTSQLGTDDDAYEFDLDSPKISPIRHLLSGRGGLLVFTEIGVWLVYGVNNQPLSANNVQADPQNNVGASYVQPTIIDSYVCYATAGGQELRLLVYDDYSKVFDSQDISLLSNHLFDPAVEITSLTYSSAPYKTLYATQDNGRLLSCTIDIKNSVYAITPNWTKGFFKTCISVAEDNEDRLYVAVERYINGNTCLFFERQVIRRTDNLDGAFCVDAGLELTKTTPAGKLVPSSSTGAVTFTTTGGTPFVSGDVGKIIRCGTGCAEITSYTSSSEVDGTWSRDLEETYPETTDPAQFESGKWYMDEEVTDITGLWHLIGESIAVLADGAVISGTTVDSTGGFTLDTAASRVCAGLGYSCVARTLPPTVNNSVIEPLGKDTISLSLRIYATEGLKYGADIDSLYEVSDRLQNSFPSAYPDRLRSELISEVPVQDWDPDNQVVFVQDSPRPAAILSVIREFDLGNSRGK